LPGAAPGAKIERCRILSRRSAATVRLAGKANCRVCAGIKHVYGATAHKLDPARREYFGGFFRISSRDSARQTCSKFAIFQD
jgi:hypothetical protein